MLKLKEYRLLKKYSQRDMARLLNVSQAHYWRWENTKALPDAKQILTLCEIFEITPNDLYGIKGIHRIAFEKTR